MSPNRHTITNSAEKKHGYLPGTPRFSHLAPSDFARCADPPSFSPSQDRTFKTPMRQVSEVYQVPHHHGEIPGGLQTSVSKLLINNSISQTACWLVGLLACSPGMAWSSSAMSLHRQHGMAWHASVKITSNWEPEFVHLTISSFVVVVIITLSCAQTTDYLPSIYCAIYPIYIYDAKCYDPFFPPNIES
jgi:hypothetical protein